MNVSLADLLHRARRLRLGWRRRRLDYDREERERAAHLARVLDAEESELRGYEREYDGLDWFHEAYGERVRAAHEAGALTDSTHWRDGKTLYVACRALEPEVAFETGVLLGSFDAHVLAALERNGRGELHSLDLPGSPPGPYEYGYLVPDRLRDRWQLHTGDARAVLGDLLADVGPVELFLHDSDHRKEHMRFEYETALPHVRAGGMLASHDVRLNGAFDAFCRRRDLDARVVADTGLARVG